jgi:hypothetical protein
MSDDELGTIRKRCEDATPGPWASFIEGRDHTSGSNFIQTSSLDGRRGPDIELSGASDSDYDFIAHARQDIPKLLVEIARLKELTASIPAPLTKVEAREIAANELKQKSPPDDLFVICDEETIERLFGWVFFFQSERFLRTGEFRDRLAGNGPIMVNKYDATIEFGGTAMPPEYWIKEYERRRTSKRKGS